MISRYQGFSDDLQAIQVFQAMVFQAMVLQAVRLSDDIEAGANTSVQCL
jgi:hypothetical protein